MPSEVAKKTVQPDVAPDFAIRLKCHTQAHFRETGELNRYLANVIVYLAFRNTQFNAVTFEDTIPLANLHRYKET